MSQLTDRQTDKPLDSFMKKFAGQKPVSALLKTAVFVSVALTFGILLFLIGYILMKGLPHLKLSLFSPVYTSDNASMFPSIINTIIITLISLLIAVPLGAFSAVYLVEYAGRGNRIVGIIRVTAETLAGIPSIVYGLFGLLFFVTYLGWGFSILAGSVTLSIMILPLVMRTSEEALKAVPDGYREASFGLGAGKLRTVFKIILPSAAPGILAGIILAIGRIAGETAALIYTAGTVAKIPDGSDFLLDSGRTLSVHMYTLSSEGLHTNEAFAASVILLLTVLLINTFSSVIAKRVART